jgi:hypothetical protein
MPLSTRNKTGLVLAVLLALSDLASLGGPTPDGEDGPPIGVLVVGALLGVATLVAVWRAWRTGSRTALRAVAGTRILSAVLALPAFFVDIPAWLQISAAVGVAVSVLCVVLVLAPAQRRVPVLD